MLIRYGNETKQAYKMKQIRYTVKFITNYYLYLVFQYIL